jgi:response regulator RpfG family c-di-GMP phosphodiesterase
MQADPARPTRPRILCVDDEAQILEAMTVNLGRQFSVTTAQSGAAGLERIRSESPFAVLISDMRMPGMDGATFLKQAFQVAPDTVRILLTGQADLNSAIAAVNEGQIFRFLSKPCPPPVLLKTIGAAVEQNRLVTSERVLLEQTLHGSIRALTDILALTSPEAFGRGLRVKRTVTRLAARLGLTERWPLEVAAMVCQIGCVILPPKVAEAFNLGKALTAEEREMVERVPATTKQLLGHIPRLEPVLEILGHPGARLWPSDRQSAPPLDHRTTPLTVRILALALDLDGLETSGVDAGSIQKALRGRAERYDPKLLDALEAESEGVIEVTRELRIQDLTPGMSFVDDVKTAGGTLLIARGHEVTPGVLERIRNFHHSVGVREPIRVNVSIRSGSAAPSVA